jgi:hypothetical protein
MGRGQIRIKFKFIPELLVSTPDTKIRRNPLNNFGVQIWEHTTGRNESSIRALPAYKYESRTKNLVIICTSWYYETESLIYYAKQAKPENKTRCL